MQQQEKPGTFRLPAHGQTRTRRSRRWFSTGRSKATLLSLIRVAEMAPDSSSSDPNKALGLSTDELTTELKKLEANKELFGDRYEAMQQELYEKWDPLADKRDKQAAQKPEKGKWKPGEFHVFESSFSLFGAPDDSPPASPAAVHSLTDAVLRPRRLEGPASEELLPAGSSTCSQAGLDREEARAALLDEEEPGDRRELRKERRRLPGAAPASVSCGELSNGFLLKEVTFPPTLLRLLFCCRRSRMRRR